jgi:TolB-like protein
MRRRSVLLALALALIAAGGVSGQEQDRRPGIAVFPFANGGSFGPGSENLADLGVGLQSMMITELAHNPALRVVERAMLRQIMEEIDLSQTDRVDVETAVRVGKLVGARYAVTGGFVDNFGRMRLDARIINVETSEVVKAEEVTQPRTELFDMVLEIAQKITADADLPPLPERSRQEREAKTIPAEAIEMLSKALVFQDAGRRDQAEQLYRQITNRFPDVEEARTQLRQLTGG